MTTLKILVPLHTLPNIKSDTTILFESLLPILRTKTRVKILWLIYTPDKLDSASKWINEDESVLDIHDYKDAVTVLQKEKPDMVYNSPTWDIMSSVFLFAARFLSIPTFCMYFGETNPDRTKVTKIKSLISRFFESSIPTDTDKNKKQFMRRGRFYLYKCKFLILTQRLVGRNYLQIIKEFLLQLMLTLSNKLFDVRYENTIHFSDSERLYHQFLTAGFKKSSIVISGNPIYDKMYSYLHYEKSNSQLDGKIGVLFAPAPLYEHGFWSKEQRDQIVKDIVSELVKEKNKISLIVKIHPSSSIISEYQTLVHSIDPSIPVYQEGDIVQFLEKSDAVLSLKSGSGEVYSLLAKKPIVIYNPFDLKGDRFLDLQLVSECKDKSLLVKTIQDCINLTPTYERHRENFIKEFLYKWDGCAAERISDNLLALLQKKTNP